MPDPNAVSSGAVGANVSLATAPGSDVSWDDLFPNPEIPAQQPQVATGTPPLSPQAEPQPFLKAGSSVYLTAEDAAKGLEHKDQLVAKYRAFLQENGIDPNELKPVAKPQAQQPQPQSPPSNFKWYKTGKLFDGLSQALSNKDLAGYQKIQEEFATEAVQDQMQQFFAPYQPLIAETARQRAIREVTREIPDFASYYGSESYRQVSERIPLIKEMEQLGESNPVAAQRLPELYKMSYLINQGLSGAKAPQAPPATPVTNPPVARQSTLAPSSLTPPAPSVNTNGWQTATIGQGVKQSNEARRQLIKDYEDRGMRDMDWSKVGY